VPTANQKARLANVIGWVQSAKENLPAINDGTVASDRIAAVSELLDRMHRIAVALEKQAAPERRQQAA
jgi:hypothetical protein